ncbi:glycosyl transferase group 1 [Fluviicola taffensis DSM 16823]|uniref:Glycosyl transferase group 1 n=2 Tax=Fluviicola TaxID=332102 RepID=F2II32_FLUTR|nr:glycosyl transferase group 1 [Fluviicola taffensis DSM 16823]
MENGFLVQTIETKSLWKSGKAIRTCRRFLKELSITQVHCHLAHANWIGLWAAKLSGIKTRMFTRHSGEPLKTHWKERLIDKIQNRLATKIVAISKNIDDLLSKQGVPKSKREIIHHGFDLERFSNPNLLEVERIKKQYNPDNLSPTIGVISRFLELKGIQYIIPAFESLLKQYPNAQLALFGASENADYSSTINELLKKIPKQNVQIVSFENNVFDLYQLFDIYLHVPINPTCEAFGQTYVEALAAGVPSIFTLSGIAREFIVNEENALVVPFEDSEAIVNSIIRLLEDKELREKLRVNGQKSVNELFSFETYIEQLQRLYSK